MQHPSLRSASSSSLLSACVSGTPFSIDRSFRAMIPDWPPYPPPQESDLEKALRIGEERDAKKISDEIDKAIERDRQDLRKRKLQTKILLLGQAESGKSTLLKNFQLQFAPKAFDAEIYAWRAVIQLNLVRSVNVILSLLAKANPPESGTTSPKQQGSLRWLKMRLAPLRQVELILNKILGVQVEIETDAEPEWDACNLSEVSLRSSAGWKMLVHSEERPTSRLWDDLQDAQRILEACREDVVAMCENPLVQNLLEQHGIALLDQPGFFFQQAGRVAAMSYEPTPEDILRARLRTVGVEEHCLAMESPPSEKGREWVFYDVGGDRGQRATWASYFEDVNAVMFLCPISAFDQVLSEDHTVNRMVDSLRLWKAICSSKLIQNATFILLLNKCDILKSKLEAGVSFVRYVESYEDQPNEYEAVTLYIKQAMQAIHKDSAPKRRKVHIHTTCAVDTDMMQIVLESIRDVILLNTLATTNLIV